MVQITRSPQETESLGARLAGKMQTGVVALTGEMGAGKTVFVRGMAEGLGLPGDLVSSPTFALVQEYGEKLVHFDMYRVETWEDLYATGFFEYLDSGALIAVEWSENISRALPGHTVQVRFERISPTERRICVEGITL